MQMEAKQQTNRKWLNRDVLKREAKRGRDNVKNDKKVHVNKKSRNIVPAFILWRRQDSNLRPSGYEPDELPTAPLRDLKGAKIPLFCE